MLDICSNSGPRGKHEKHSNATVAELLLSLNGSLGAWSSSLNLQCSAQLNKEVPGTPSFCHSECGSVGLPPGL